MYIHMCVCVYVYTHIDMLEKEMPTHKNISSILAWKTSWTEEPGGLHTMGSQRVRHDLVTNIYMYVYTPHLVYPFIC